MVNTVQSNSGLNARSNTGVVVKQEPKVGTNRELSENQSIVGIVASVDIKKVDVIESNKPTQQAIAKAANDIQNFVKEMGRNLQFSIDKTTGYNVVRVVNPDTQELIRQLPSEELLKIAASMQEMGSVLVNQKA
jgi:flagellar protein FlaG